MRAVTTRRPAPPRRLIRSLPAVILAATLVGCTSTVAGTAVVGDGAAVTTGGSGVTGGVTPPDSSSPAVAPAPVPAGLEDYYAQELDWGSCAALATSEELDFYRSASLQCADLTVPLDYSDPTGSTITLKVLRKPATTPAERIGSVITNPGGPGVSGVENAGGIGAYGLAAELNEVFDLVGFDPRGVGASEPAILCQTDEQRDAARAQTLRTRTQAEVDAANAAAEQIANGCATLTGAEQGIDGEAFLANVGTRSVAKDLDILRAVLGDDQLTYIGWSYGTAIGTEYATQFPDNVRALILDGAIDPAADPSTDLLGQVEGFQKAFDDFVAWCADQPECVLGDDPEKSQAAYLALVRPLLDTPLELADGRVLTHGDAETATVSALYGEDSWQALADALKDLADGDGTALMALADQYEQRASDGTYTNWQDPFLAISCIDGSRNYDPDQVEQLAVKTAAAAPFSDSGDPPRWVKGPCDFWPVPPASAPELPDVDGLPTVLVISTTGDPATPYQAGVNLADALGASLLTVEGTNHTAYLGNSCVDEIGTTYLVTLELPADDTICQ